MSQEYDDPAEPNPYLRLTHRLIEPAGMGKTAFRAHRLAFVEAGNHFVRHPSEAIADGLEIRHVPFRTTEQGLRKIMQGTAALRLTDQDEQIGTHWRILAERDEAGIAQYYRRAKKAAILDPAPFTPLPR